MKRLALSTLCLGFALAAGAQTPAPADPAVDAPTPPPSAQAEEATTDIEAKDKLADRNCLKETGSRVIRADRNGRKCANATGQAYTKEDLDRTGEISLDDALRKLDPRIR